MGGRGGGYHEGVYPRPKQSGWGLSEVRTELSRELGCPAEVSVSYRQPVNQLVCFQGAAMKTPDSAGADQSDVQWPGPPYLLKWERSRWYVCRIGCDSTALAAFRHR
jgi:hypothetical protein